MSILIDILRKMKLVPVDLVISATAPVVCPIMKKSFWLTSVKLVCKIYKSQKAWGMAFKINAGDHTVVCVLEYIITL